MRSLLLYTTLYTTVAVLAYNSQAWTATAQPVAPNPALLARCYTTTMDMGFEMAQIAPVQGVGEAVADVRNACRQSVLDQGEAGYICFERVYWLAIRGRGSMSTDVARSLYQECVAFR